MKILKDNIYVRLFFFFIGIIICYHGIAVIKNGILSYYGVSIIVTESKCFTGGILIFLGLFCLWLSIYRRTLGIIEGNFYKCTSCGEVADSKSMNNLRCAKCSGTLEELEGFYDRNPLFKNKSEKNHDSQ